MNSTNLNDKWSRIAARTNAPEERKPAIPTPPKITVLPKPAGKSSIPRLSPAEVQDLVKKGLVTMPGVARPVEKNGAPLAAEGAQRSQWMDITPALARTWLQNNFRNRPIAEDTVAAYARDMAARAWVATHQGIAFNDRDELIDGQHRLHAIIRAGVTVRMMVTFGLPSKIAGSKMTTMDAVDRGRTRSVADQLKIQHGMKRGSIIAAVCATLGGLCFGERTKRLSVGQTLEIFRAFEHPINFVVANRSKEHGLKAAGVLAGFALALAVEPKASEWYVTLSSGRALPENSALGRLRDFLISPDATLLTRTMDRGVSELVLQALWLHGHGKEVERLAHALDGLDYFKGKQLARVETIATLFRLPK